MVENKEDPVEAALDKLKPMLQQLSFGSFMGYCSGMALKKVGKAVAFVIGAGFVGLQGAAYCGYIDVDWIKIKDDALKPLDTVSP
jgi:FUN14 domain-containing protein 1